MVHRPHPFGSYLLSYPLPVSFCAGINLVSMSATKRSVQLIVKDKMLIFWGTSQSVPQILNVIGSFGWTRSTIVAFIGICCTSSHPKFGHEMFSLPFFMYFFPAKISLVLSEEPIVSEAPIFWQSRLQRFLSSTVYYTV